MLNNSWKQHIMPFVIYYKCTKRDNNFNLETVIIIPDYKL